VTVGVPRILPFLKKYEIPATFCPGANAEKYSDVVKRIDAEGHEVGIMVISMNMSAS
jgi:peptidoglycan/xylan/chitin deacetylase (PgdA/CDA1 family)